MCVYINVLVLGVGMGVGVVCVPLDHFLSIVKYLLNLFIITP